MKIYQLTDGKWAVSFLGTLASGFTSRKEAVEWVLGEIEECLAGLIISTGEVINTEKGATEEVEEQEKDCPQV